MIPAVIISIVIIIALVTIAVWASRKLQASLAMEVAIICIAVIIAQMLALGIANWNGTVIHWHGGARVAGNVK